MRVFKKSCPPSVTNSLALHLVTFWVRGLSYSPAQKKRAPNYLSETPTFWRPLLSNKIALKMSYGIIIMFI